VEGRQDRRMHPSALPCPLHHLSQRRRSPSAGAITVRWRVIIVVEIPGAGSLQHPRDVQATPRAPYLNSERRRAVALDCQGLQGQDRQRQRGCGSATGRQDMLAAFPLLQRRHHRHLLPRCRCALMPKPPTVPLREVSSSRTSLWVLLF